MAGLTTAPFIDVATPNSSRKLTPEVSPVLGRPRPREAPSGVRICSPAANGTAAFAVASCIWRFLLVVGPIIVVDTSLALDLTVTTFRLPR